MCPNSYLAVVFCGKYNYTIIPNIPIVINRIIKIIPAGRPISKSGKGVSVVVSVEFGNGSHSSIEALVSKGKHRNHYNFI